MELHRPQKLDNFLFHQNTVKLLKQFIDTDSEIPNMIFYGPDGSGKKSCLYTFLEEKYSIKTTNIKCINKIFKINSKDVEIPYFYSNYHVEIQVSDLSNYARNILPEIIKTIGSTKNIIHNGCKILIIHQVHLLDTFTQNMLRRFFEIYNKTCRFILLTKHLNFIIPPLQSRCLLIRFCAPTTLQIKSCIPNFSKNHRNMKLAWIEHYYDRFKDPIEKYIYDVINRKNVDIREFIYLLLVKNYNFIDVLESIYEILRKNINHNDMCKIIPIISKYSQRLINGSRDILHIEAFLLHLNCILYN
jgi:replication-associated recombination protein RarA